MSVQSPKAVHFPDNHSTISGTTLCSNTPLDDIKPHSHNKPRASRIDLEAQKDPRDASVNADLLKYYSGKPHKSRWLLGAIFVAIMVAAIVPIAIRVSKD